MTTPTAADAAETIRRIVDALPPTDAADRAVAQLLLFAADVFDLDAPTPHRVRRTHGGPNTAPSRAA